MDPLEERLEQVFSRCINKIVISKPRSKAAAYRRVELELKNHGYHVSKYTDKQVFHENIQPQAARSYCAGFLRADFLQFNAWDECDELILLLSQKGTVTLKTKKIAASGAPKVSAAHNREKQYILPEGTVIPPLVDLGIFTKDGAVVRSMYDKFRQINRFIELVDDAVGHESFTRLNILDFGCGKSYLTFVLYYYFTQIRRIPVSIVGLDLKAEVIDKCNEAARRYGYTNLRFELGDINGYQCAEPVDLVLSLHACDTATDYALYNAVRWNARMIFCVPCCQHELNGQLESDSLALLARYGIVKERFSALATDAIRGGLLEACGYKVQLLEFVDFAHTPKNILIRAVRKAGGTARDPAARAHVERLMETFQFKPTLYSLLSTYLDG